MAAYSSELPDGLRGVKQGQTTPKDLAYLYAVKVHVQHEKSAVSVAYREEVDAAEVLSKEVVVEGVFTVKLHPVYDALDALRFALR